VLYPFFGISPQPDYRQRGDVVKLGISDCECDTAKKREVVTNV
jgi:hypothetical protein